jgi:tRNA (uracil-5-)-methyltransferase TRM9
MDRETVDRLLEINGLFYQTFALQFSQTRQRIQPGVRKIIERIPKDASILDLGCGNGELWKTLAENGYRGCYVGLDASPGLLDIASQKYSDRLPNTPTFIQANLADSGWDEALCQSQSEVGCFDQVMAFAVFHHLPGHNLRRQTLEMVHELLCPGGQFIHSEWQFLNSPRLKARLQPWNFAGIAENQVDHGDYLLDWRHGGSGLRYVHQFDPGELEQLASETRYRIEETFNSDGVDGNLSLYQIWTAVK